MFQTTNTRWSKITKLIQKINSQKRKIKIWDEDRLKKNRETYLSKSIDVKGIQIYKFTISSLGWLTSVWAMIARLSRWKRLSKRCFVWREDSWRNFKLNWRTKQSNGDVELTYPRFLYIIKIFLARAKSVDTRVSLCSDWVGLERVSVLPS